MEQQDPYKAPEPVEAPTEEPKQKTREQVRHEYPAAKRDALDAFRSAVASRHAERCALLETEDVKLLPFLEQEFIRIQRDAVRAVLVAANLQAECIAQDVK